MIAIIIFLVGFYLGILVFSLLAVSRKKAANQSSARFPVMYPLRKPNQIMRAHRIQSTNHGFGDAGNIL